MNAENPSTPKIDELTKNRHSGKNRSPENLNYLKELDSGFRRNDRKTYFPPFYEIIKIKTQKKNSSESLPF
jgi:hypothetical protein